MQDYLAQETTSIQKEKNEINRQVEVKVVKKFKNKNDGIQLSSRYLQYTFAKRHLRGTSRPEVFPILGTNSKIIKQVNNPTHSNNRVYDDSGIAPTINTMQGGNRQPKIAIPVLTPDRAKKRQNGRRFKTNGEPSFTLTAQDRHGVVVNRKDGIKKETDIAGTISASDWRGLNRNQDQTAVIEKMAIRKLTPIETERLQAFPDNWTKYGHDGKEISDTQRYKQMGNAVTTSVISAIISEMFN